MQKIPTIFDRNWEGDKTVIDKFSVDPAMYDFYGAIATEKLDGMNVRVTVRSGKMVRLEKRRNPDKTQKTNGIIDPWYVDADEYSPQDKYLFEAVKNTSMADLPDGEWSGEALGPFIQGNTLKLDSHRIVFFTLKQAPVFENVPTNYTELKEWLPAQKSKYGNDCGIEGIVWHFSNGAMAKIKTKDFVKDNR